MKQVQQKVVLSRQVWLVLASLCSILLICSYAVFKNDQQTKQHASETEVEQHETVVLAGKQDERSPGSPAGLRYESQHGPLPPSLRGTELDHTLAVDAQGHLRVSSDIRMVFDYFLSAIHEESVETLVSRINEYLEHYLEQPALDEAKSILLAYIDLKKALYDYELERSEQVQAMMEQGMSPANKARYLSMLEDQLNERNTLRATHLPAEVHQAFYHSEEAYDSYTLSRMKVMANESLTQKEKNRQLEIIDSMTAPEIVAGREEAQIVENLTNKTKELQEAKASKEEIHQLRVDMLGEEAAQRFAKLDSERAEWNTRLADYLQKRKQILALEGLSEQDKNAQVEDLRASSFDAREQIRVRAYENRDQA